jgi:hypothetical protein
MSESRGKRAEAMPTMPFDPKPEGRKEAGKEDAAAKGKQTTKAGGKSECKSSK